MLLALLVLQSVAGVQRPMPRTLAMAAYPLSDIRLASVMRMIAAKK
jgi:hypothetical protein